MCELGNSYSRSMENEVEEFKRRKLVVRTHIWKGFCRLGLALVIVQEQEYEQSLLQIFN